MQTIEGVNDFRACILLSADAMRTKSMAANTITHNIDSGLVRSNNNERGINLEFIDRGKRWSPITKIVVMTSKVLQRLFSISVMVFHTTYRGDVIRSSTKMADHENMERPLVFLPGKADC